MLFLLYFFVIASILFLIAISICYVYTCRTANKLAGIFKRLQQTSFVAILLCLIFYWIPNKTIAKVVWGLYLVKVDVIYLWLLKFITKSDKDRTYPVKINRGFYHIVNFIFICIEIVLIVINLWTGIIYDISKLVVDNDFSVWVLQFKPLVFFHVFVCFSILLSICVILIKYIIVSNRYRRSAYVSLLVFVLFTFFMDTLFLFVSNQWIFNFSSIILGYLLMILYGIVYYTVPKYVQKNLISISSENISDAIICFDENDSFTYANKLGRALYAFEKQSGLFEKYINCQSDLLVGTEKIESEKDTHHYKVEFRRIRDNNNKNCGCYLKFTDCTKEIQTIEYETYKATHDELTGLYSRDYFFKEMTRLLKEEPDVPRYLVCTDIKDFKLVNELFGPAFGDRLLVRQAELLKRANYKDTIWGRISGDRFAMLIKKDDFKPDMAEKNSNSIIEMENEVNFKLVIYICVYEITDPTENVHTMYDKTTLVIKNIPHDEAKTVIFCDENRMNKIVEEKGIVSEFDNALAENQFEMYLQPQIDAKSGKCNGAEALVRWNHPQKGLLGPVSFIKVFEQTDQIHKLDFYIWETAAFTLSQWKAKNIEHSISINISVKDFYYADLYKYFTELVQKYDISPSKLKLEITESIIDNDKSHCSTLIKLQEYGFIIEMDDFGSGYSSLNALKNVPMDVLKLDMEFLRKTQNSERAKLVVSSIVKMAKALNMEVISEGVETQTQADILKDFGVDTFQGYLFSKPISVMDFEQKYLGGN